MDDQYEIQVNGVTRQEYIQAGSESIRRMVLPLLVLVAVVTVIIALAIQDFSLRSILPPFVIAVLFLVMAEIAVGVSWRKFPADVTFTYLIDRDGWEMTVGEDRANIDWQDTVRMTIRRHVVLLYNEGNRSNLLPRRCLTPEQLAQMKVWYTESRRAQKARQKEKDEKFRADYRAKRMAEKMSKKRKF